MNLNSFCVHWYRVVPLYIQKVYEISFLYQVLLGALQDNGRTIVLGERTFGKGVVQVSCYVSIE